MDEDILYPLQGNTTTLEPLGESMAEELLEALLESKTALCEFMPWDCWDMEAVNDFLLKVARGWAKNTHFTYAVRSRDDNSLLGVLGQDFDPYTPRADVGYWVRSSHNGNGYATDAWHVLLHFCRDELKLVRLDACAAATNTASQNVLRKCGFEEEGFKGKAQCCHGQWHDLVLFGKLL